MTPTTLECISTALLAIPCIVLIIAAAWGLFADWLKAQRRGDYKYGDSRIRYMYRKKGKGVW